MFMVATLFTSCSHDIIDYKEAVTEKYKVEFVNTFGTPDIEHNWGFEEVALTRSADVNSNMWDYTPPAITQEEITKVNNYFKNHPNPTSIEVEWQNFFVQHVIGNHGNMDQLRVNDNDHVNNFNANNGSVMKMVNTSSTKFNYHNSLDSKYHYEYVILEIDGSYYVGFDFCATGQNPNQKEAADGIYNDWIVKISPAYNKIVIAEDLGASVSDYDFNDVVFGIDNKNVVTLLAAGGTLPLTIDGIEVHEKFGVSIRTMVNTGAGPSLPPVQFKIGTYDRIQDIPLVVSGSYPIPYFKGEPSAKICVDRGFTWTAEQVPIYNVYPRFKDYVTNQNVIWY